MSDVPSVEPRTKRLEDAQRKAADGKAIGARAQKGKLQRQHTAGALEDADLSLTNAAEPGGPLEPSASLSEEEAQHYRAIVASQNRGFWIESDRYIIEQYVRTWTRLRKAEESLTKQGDVMYSKRGTPVLNPLVSIRTQILREIKMLSFILSSSPYARLSPRILHSRNGSARPGQSAARIESAFDQTAENVEGAAENREKALSLLAGMGSRDDADGDPDEDEDDEEQ